jgi:hypothetical protein
VDAREKREGVKASRDDRRKHFFSFFFASLFSTP